MTAPKYKIPVTVQFRSNTSHEASHTCLTCGATVSSTFLEKHRSWHAELETK